MTNFKVNPHSFDFSDLIYKIKFILNSIQLHAGIIYLNSTKCVIEKLNY